LAARAGQSRPIAEAPNDSEALDLDRAMTETDAIAIAKHYVSSLFPRTCRCCKREFVSFKDFITNTKPVGEVMSWDADQQDWEPNQPLGITALANCSCGSTLAISSERMPLSDLWKLMRWAQLECSQRGVAPKAIFTALRDKTVAQILAEPAAGL
jgi:hypothetical protein